MSHRKDRHSLSPPAGCQRGGGGCESFEMPLTLKASQSEPDGDHMAPILSQASHLLLLYSALSNR